jgi:large subunit ribosomal protein L3
MPKALLGRKIGMTRLYDGEGRNVPVTVIEVGPCFVSQVKTAESDGYSAVQLAFGDVKARGSTMPLIGHDAKAGLTPKRVHREVRLSDEEVVEFEPGQSLGVDSLESVVFVDVTGTSKGKGFAGVMKRHGFKGQPASHGTERKHRSPGSIGGRGTDLGGGRPKKGIRMAGQMGGGQVTVRSLEIVGRDSDRGLLMVKGPVPGARQGIVLIREAKRLYKRKAKKVAEAS